MFIALATVKNKNPSITTIKKTCDDLDITITDFFDIETFKILNRESKNKPAFHRRLILCIHFKISSFSSNTADAALQAGQSQFAMP